MKDSAPFVFLCGSFPGIDQRVIKATILEHGDDIESALTFLLDYIGEGNDTSQLLKLVNEYNSYLSVITQIRPLEPIDLETLKAHSRDSQKVIQLENRSCVNEDILYSDDMSSNLEKKAETQFRSPEMSCEYVDCEQSGIAGYYDEVSIAKVSEKEHTVSEPDQTPDTEQSESRLCEGSGYAVETGADCGTESFNAVNITSVKELSISCLEEIVSQAHKDKDYVVNLIKEVSDLRAKADEESIAAEKAKVEADRGGVDLFVKAAETRARVLQMKQENLMRRGEIYGEKAVLALEARELMLRLEQVKQEKEKAVATLLEIRTRLQACYETALVERRNAVMDRKAKEESAQKVLEKEEALMAIEEQESYKLKIEAENSARLRESIVDHGHVIDVLQGEISVLCEDVESFKKQVEEGVWSSMSAASSAHSGINPGPYSFRRHHPRSTASMHDSGKSFGSYKSRNSGSNIFQNRDSMERLGSTFDNASSLSSSLNQVSYENALNRGNHAWAIFSEHSSSSCESLGGDRSDKSVYLTDINTSLSIAIEPPPLGPTQGNINNVATQEKSLVDVSYGYGMDQALPQQGLKHMNEDPFENNESFLKTKECSDGSMKQAKNICYSSDPLSHNGQDCEWMCKDTVGDWVLTKQSDQLSSSPSSSTSSLVKLEIHDFRLVLPS